MSATHRTAPWTLSGWKEQAEAWILAALEKRGLTVSGPIEQPHVRYWSTVLRVPTTNETLYFKATASMLLHEAGVTQLVTEIGGDAVPELLAVDTEKGWMLMRDAGQQMRNMVKEDGDIRHWQKALLVYGELQCRLCSHTEELLNRGVPDRRLQHLPALYEELLADTPVLCIGEKDGLTTEEYDRLRALIPDIPRLCDELESLAAVPETLDHNDLHDNNIFVKEGRYQIADWGDCCVTHPFFSMVVVLRSAAHTLGLPDNAPELDTLYAAYLEPWSAYGTPEQLDAACRAALKLGTLGRVLNWYNVIRNLDEADRAEYAEAVPGWLQEFLKA